MFILSFRLACARCLGIRNLSESLYRRIPLHKGVQADALHSLKAPTSGAGMTAFFSELRSLWTDFMYIRFLITNKTEGGVQCLD